MKKLDNFIIDIINKNLNEKTCNSEISTRFPPEPNGYLHIGHAKSICLNFGIAEQYKGKCNLRFDDTNPLKEDLEYVNSIIEDVKWLGYKWDNQPLYASDYFQEMYDYAIQLVKQGDAYVDDQDSELIKNTRGTLSIPGTNSPFRDRSVKENLALFIKMKNGDFQTGEKVLRAKIDMTSPNINLRDPIIYRIMHTPHHRTKKQWCIYPMYDWAHGIEDSIEKITHSICTLEFEDHRPLYDWFLQKLNIYHPQQIEFARLNLSYTILSKRNLKLLVDKNYVSSWDDPRMPTLSGLRRRGYTPESIQNFVKETGVAKRNSISDIALLEFCLREHLNKIAYRVMAVFNPLKVIITNYPNDKKEFLEAVNNPENKSYGTRKIPFAKELYIERTDFMENPPNKFFRLSPNKEVRLLHAYYITCNNIIKDEQGKIEEIHCTYDPKSRGGWSNDGRKVKGTLHWVCKQHSIDATVNIYDRLFKCEDPTKGSDNFIDNINNNSLQIINNVKIEPSLKDASVNQKYQFVRKGYFSLDQNLKNNQLIFNQSVALRDTWVKKQY